MSELEPSTAAFLKLVKLEGAVSDIQAAAADLDVVSDATLREGSLSAEMKKTMTGTSEYVVFVLTDGEAKALSEAIHLIGERVDPLIGAFKAVFDTIREPAA